MYTNSFTGAFLPYREFLRRRTQCSLARQSTVSDALTCPSSLILKTKMGERGKEKGGAVKTKGGAERGREGRREGGRGEERKGKGQR